MTLHGRWSEPKFPHKGWSCVDIYDRGEDALEPCEMACGAEVRYVHVMEHPDFPEKIEVGCVCAGHLEEDYEKAQTRERQFKNQQQRAERERRNREFLLELERARFFASDWPRSKSGYPFKKCQGFVVIVNARPKRYTVYVKRDGAENGDEIGTFQTPPEAKHAAWDYIQAKGQK